MNTKSKFINVIFWRETIFSTLIAIGLYFILHSFFSLLRLNPEINNNSDFDISDVFFSLKDPKVNTSLDENIIIINSGDSTRRPISQLLQKVMSCHPAVVGVDLLFENSKGEEDTLLIDIAKEYGNKIILASSIQNDTIIHSFNPISRPPVENGFANVITKDENNVIRSFKYKSNGVYSFSALVARKFYYNSFNTLLTKDSDEVVINYQRSDGPLPYPVVEIDEILRSSIHDLQYLENKIILIGYYGPSIDQNGNREQYHTPLEKNIFSNSAPVAYGVEIHAQIISMIIGNNYVTKTGHFGNWVFIFSIIFIQMLLLLYIFKNYKYKFFILHLFLIQPLTSCLVFLLSLHLFSRHNIMLDINTTLIIIWVSGESLHLTKSIYKFYEGFVKKACSILNMKPPHKINSYFKD